MSLQKHKDGLRVLHTIASLRASAGGPSRTVTSLCEGLGRLGQHITIVTQKGSNKSHNIVADSNLAETIFVDTASIFRLNLYSPLFRSALAKCCTKAGIQLMHDHGMWLPSNHSAASVARHLKLPLIISPRGMLEPWALSYRGWKKRVAWKCYQHRDLLSADVFCATSEKEAENIRKLGFRQPIAVIANGVTLPALTSHNLPKDRELTALFLSRIHPVKGLLELVEAWRRVRPDGWRVIIAGPNEGGHQQKVETAICKVKLPDVFKFVGAVEGERKHALFQQADLFMLPSFTENFGVAVAEALSYGIPVVTTRGTPWELIEKHKCGWWVPLGVEHLAEAIREACALSDLERSEMGKRGRMLVEVNYDWSQISKKMLSLYNWVLRKGPRPDFVWSCQC